MSMVTMTVFPDLSGRAANEYATSFDGLVTWLQQLPEYPTKAACPLLSLNRYGATRTETKQSLRHDANILAATGAIGDYDAGQIAPADAAGLLSAVGIQSVIVTTPSHGLKGSRWRLLLPFAQERTLDERYSYLARVNTLLGGVLAGESFTASQSFYVGRVVGVAYEVIATEGRPVDERPDLAALPETGRPMARARVAGPVDELDLIPKMAEGGAEQIVKALDLIANPGHDWEFWNKIGMACYNASGGSDAGLEAWRDWSEQCDGDGDSVDARWMHYLGSPPSELGMGTLVHLAGGLAAINPPDNVAADSMGAPTLRANGDKQRAFAETIRAAKLAECGADTDLAMKLTHGGTTAKFWIENRERSVADLGQLLTPVDHVTGPFVGANEPRTVGGFQYLAADLQIEHFKGCAYVQDQHRIFTPTGSLLREGQFNATYGGYVFQLDDGGDKTTRKAWEAFTESQVVRFPKVETTCFKPAEPSGAIIEDEGRQLVNVFVPLTTRRVSGDPSRFLAHLNKLIPDANDREILLAYMAACVQYPGIKFQWAPVLQGTPGNGKTLFTRCIAAAIGKRYTHYPKASDLMNKFNSWLLNKIFIGVEDIYVADHMAEMVETLKPMITGDGLEIQGKGTDQFTSFDMCANFMFNMNKKDGAKFIVNDRRYAPFFTPQQSEDDVIRDGMGGDYFPDLYNWLKGEGDYYELGAGYGYAVVADFLSTYEIPAHLNPATMALHRAPRTSSTDEAVSASLGTVEQEILEAVDEGRQGFAGGWISSFALDRLLHSLRRAQAIPPNKRRDLLTQLGYDWHPSLSHGRVNNPTVTDGGKTRLFIKSGHLSANLTRPSEIVKAYDAAQQVGITATDVFGESDERR